MLPSCEDLQLENKRVFLRVDFNVPLDKEGKISDDSRMKASLPTIKYLMQKGAKLIVASHLGRPKGQVNPKFSLLPVAEHLAKLLDREVIFPDAGLGDGLRKLASELEPNQLILLENLRFDPGEEANDVDFARKLANLCDVYINDAFGTMHRSHASTVGMLAFVQEKAAGFLVQKEVKFLSQLLNEPPRPFVAILGGAKVSDKIAVIENFLKKVDVLLIGGAMAYTFLAAQGQRVGISLVESDKFHQARKMLEKARVKGIPLVLPSDHVVAKSLDEASEKRTTLGQEITGEWMGVDIGPKTLEDFKNHLYGAKTIFWNGPVGAFEIPSFARGSVQLAKMISESNAMSVIGGGDSLAAVKVAGVADKMTHLSTGGGASLEFLEGKKLPGLVALES
ncbi:MAG: phosphoglycerate kinase [Deltaproteobacteria bacterium]|nr:phosphoglycerate kinase [Deltaproteobacteria bacterium]